MGKPKVTAELAARVFELNASGELSQEQIGVIVGLSKAAVWCILHHKTGIQKPDVIQCVQPYFDPCLPYRCEGCKAMVATKPCVLCTNRKLREEFEAA